jgi:hypothetical protein
MGSAVYPFAQPPAGCTFVGIVSAPSGDSAWEGVDLLPRNFDTIVDVLVYHTRGWNVTIGTRIFREDEGIGQK